MRNESIRYLIVPGWQGSPEDHWQTHWQNSLPNSARVEQADWLTPRREDWVAALAEAIAADDTPVILIAQQADDDHHGNGHGDDGRGAALVYSARVMDAASQYGASA